MGNVAIIDGKNLLWRAADVGGTLARTIERFFEMAANVRRILKAEIVFAWEGRGVNWRTVLYPAYKANRQIGEESTTEKIVGLAVPVLEVMLDQLGARSWYGINCEGDDVIATLAESMREEDRFRQVWIVSVDRDLWQLVDDRRPIVISCATRGARTFAAVFGNSNRLGRVIDEEAVREEFCEPSRIPLYKALAGDSGDGFPGVRGVGPKAAKYLTERYGTIDDLTKAAANGDGAKWKADGMKAGLPDILLSQVDRLELFYKIASVQRDSEIATASNIEPDLYTARMIAARGGVTMATEQIERFAEVVSC